MTELELIRAAADRRTYELETIGALRLKGWLLRSATADAAGETFLFRRTSWASAAVEAEDRSGRTIGTFRPREIRRGGAIDWRGAKYDLRPATPIRERYQLIHGERELASIEARGWWGWGARRPLTMRLNERDGLEPGLLLFVAFAVRTLADKSNSDASGATVATNTSAYGGG